MTLFLVVSLAGYYFSTSIATCELDGPWRICPSNYVRVDRASGSVQYGDLSECISVPKTNFPSTILAAETDIQKRYLNPYQDLNLLAIPDLSWSSAAFDGREHYTRWYILDRIACGDDDKPARKRALQFRGVQYEAEISFVRASTIIGNTTRICCGMYKRGWVTAPDAQSSSSELSLLVKVIPPPVPGTPSWYYFGKDTPKPRGQGGNHEMARNGPITQFSLGWDWSQHTPDRHTGIWDKVFLMEYARPESECRPSSVVGFEREGKFGTDSGGLQVEYVVKHFDKDQVALQNLTIRFKLLYNELSDADAERNRDDDLGVLHIDLWELSLDGVGEEKKLVRKISFSRGDRLTLKRKHLREGGVSLQLGAVGNVKAWYPHRFGDPVLHKLEARLYQSDTECDSFPNGQEVVLDMVETRLGFRTFSIEQVPQRGDSAEHGTRGVVNVPIINGNPVFLSGGNWIVMDQFLRRTGDFDAYHTQLWLHKEMGFDMIRVWGGAVTERPEFYDAADELGLLVWQELWMTGDNNGRWAGSYSWPDDPQNYYESAKDMSVMLHNHCSLVIWCLGNELDGHEGNGTLNKRIYDFLVASDVPHQGSTNAPYVLQSSMGNWTSFDATKQATAKDGTYGVLSDREAFTRNPAVMVWKNGELVRADGTFGREHVFMEFNPEAGSSAIPVYDSYLEMFSTEVREKYQNKLYPVSQEEETEATDGKRYSFDSPAEVEKLVLGAKTNVEAIHQINTAYSMSSKPYPLGWHNYLGWLDTDGVNWVLDRYGSGSHIRSLRDFCKFANLAHFEQVRLLFEGRLKYMGIDVEQGSKDESSIVSAGNTMLLYWKSQSPWPSFRGFLYDWNLRLTGGFYGSRAALRNNLHIFAEFPQKDEKYPMIRVSNRGVSSWDAALEACAELYDWKGKLFSEVCNHIAGMKSMSVVQLDLLLSKTGLRLSDLSTLSLVRLSVTPYGQKGIILDRNDYFFDTFRRTLGAQALSSSAKLPQLLLKSVDVVRKGVVEVVVGWTPNEQSANIAMVAGVHVVLSTQLESTDQKFTFTCDIGYFILIPEETRHVVCTYRRLNVLHAMSSSEISIVVSGFNARDSVPYRVGKSSTSLLRRQHDVEEQLDGKELAIFE